MTCQDLFSTDAVNQATIFLQILVDTAIICVANNKHVFSFWQNYEYVYTSQSHNCNIAQLNRLN